jgi:hypothetical protein
MKSKEALVMSISTRRQAPKLFSSASLLSACILLAATAAHSQTLKTTVLADGSTVGLPPYWWVAAQSPGSMDIKGPRGEGISLGAALPVYNSPPGPAIGNYRPMVAPCCDPVRATNALWPQIANGQRAAGIPAPELRQVVDSQLAPDGHGAYLLMELDLHGQKILQYAYILCSPTGLNQWMYYVSAVGAPESIFRDELPLMIEVWKSWSINPEVQHQRLQHAVETMKAAWEIYRSGEEKSQDAHHRSTCASDDLVRGQIEIENPQTGEHKKVPNDSAQWWINRGWKYVPASKTTC